jgi:hypothetical protein
MQAGRQMRKLLLRAFIRQAWNCADSLCAVPTGVSAVMIGKSYEEFMEDVYA